MGITAADMDSCVPKALCLSGPNEGLAYDPSDPCSSFPSTNFDPLKCDCVPFLPTNDVQWRATSGNVRPYGFSVCGVNYFCTIPTQWQTVLGAPSYDAEGRLTQTAVCPMISWGCNFSALQCEFCDASSLSPFPATVTVTKTGNCGGGSAAILYLGLLTYKDGVLFNAGNSLTRIFYTLGGTFCDPSFPIGYTWTVNLEYRTSDGQGGWLPGIQ